MSGLNGILIMFICNHCPYVRSIEKKIAIETSRLKEIKVNSLAIMSNDQSSYPEDSNIIYWSRFQGLILILSI